MSGMHLLPMYYTTTNTRKRKANKKSKSLIEAERKHAKFLKSIMGKSAGKANDTKHVNKYRAESQQRLMKGNQIPFLSPTSDIIPVGATGKRKTIEHNFTIAPAYNKGAYQVISKRDIKDIGR